MARFVISVVGFCSNVVLFGKVDMAVALEQTEDVAKFRVDPKKCKAFPDVEDTCYNFVQNVIGMQNVRSFNGRDEHGVEVEQKWTIGGGDMCYLGPAAFSWADGQVPKSDFFTRTQEYLTAELGHRDGEIQVEGSGATPTYGFHFSWTARDDNNWDIAADKRPHYTLRFKSSPVNEKSVYAKHNVRSWYLVACPGNEWVFNTAEASCIANDAARKDVKEVGPDRSWKNAKSFLSRPNSAKKQRYDKFMEKVRSEYQKDFTERNQVPYPIAKALWSMRDHNSLQIRIPNQ